MDKQYTAEVIVGHDNTGRLKKAKEFLEKNYVLVGIPDSNLNESFDINQNPENEEKRYVTNAELLYIHTKGSPINNIPARPVIEPSIENNIEIFEKILFSMIEDVLSGNEASAQDKLEKLGMAGQSYARKWFTDPRNEWPENKPSVKKRKMKKGSTDPKPLIDTGELRKSITYVVVKDGVREK